MASFGSSCKLDLLFFLLCILAQLQVEKEKQSIPVVQLNLIRLLADLSVAANRSEVVDMILPLFIENLEEGDASTPGVLRLRVWNLSVFEHCYLLLQFMNLLFINVFSLQDASKICFVKSVLIQRISYSFRFQ